MRDSQQVMNDRIMERESFIFYRSFYDSIQTLGKKQQLSVYDAICRFALFGEETELSGPGAGLFMLMRPNIEANTRKYLNGCKGGEYGSMGGRPKNPKKTPSEPQENPNEAPNVNVTVTVTDTEDGAGDVYNKAADDIPALSSELESILNDLEV